jgi:hypothetical protein
MFAQFSGLIDEIAQAWTAVTKAVSKTDLPEPQYPFTRSAS